MPKKILTFAVFAEVLLSGCDTKMDSENAQTIRLEMTKGSGPVSGILKASTPGMAGISSKNFDLWTLSVDGRELKRGPDMVVEDDKGPRVTFEVGSKKPDQEKG